MPMSNKINTLSKSSYGLTGQELRGSVQGLPGCAGKGGR